MQLNAHVIREEKSLRHFVMVAKFLDDNKPNFCVVFSYGMYSIKWVREIRAFHVADDG